MTPKIVDGWELQIGMSDDLSEVWCDVWSYGELWYGMTVETRDIHRLQYWVRSLEISPNATVAAIRELEICEARYQYELETPRNITGVWISFDTLLAAFVLAVCLGFLLLLWR